MPRRTLVASLVACVFWVSLPLLADAAGLVPCGGTGGEPCQACHVTRLINNVVTWLVGVFSIIAAILFTVAGFKLVVSGGNEAAKTAAKQTFYNVFMGYLLVLCGWLLVDTLLKALVSDQVYGVWNQIQCVDQSFATPGRLTATGDNAQLLPSADVDARVAAIRAAGPVAAQAVAAATAAGLSAEQATYFQALVMQESNMCRSVVGPSTQYGQALGCGQLLLSTARQLDPSATEQRLREDNAYNLSLSAQYFARQLQTSRGDMATALAAYNGGPGANRDSQDCPGLKAWQCEWDSPGCHNTGRTDCRRNTGPNSYAQTRHYVANINNMANRLNRPTSN